MKTKVKIEVVTATSQEHLGQLEAAKVKQGDFPVGFGGNS